MQEQAVQECSCTSLQALQLADKGLCSSPGFRLGTWDNVAKCILPRTTCFELASVNQLSSTQMNQPQYADVWKLTGLSSVSSSFSTTALPEKKPRPSGLYGTIPIPSSLQQSDHPPSFSMCVNPKPGTNGGRAGKTILPGQRDDLLFNVTRPKRPLNLQRTYGMDRVSTSDCVSARLGEANVLNFPFFHQLLQFSNLEFPNYSYVMKDRHDF